MTQTTREGEMNSPVEDAARYGIGYAASGTALGTTGLAFAEHWPLILQLGNLALVLVSVFVGVLSASEKIRHWAKESRQEREDAKKAERERRLHDAALRYYGVPVDSKTSTSPAPLDDDLSGHDNGAGR